MLFTFVHEHKGYSSNDKSKNSLINSNGNQNGKKTDNQAEKKIPRPPNSYILYRAANYNKIALRLKKEGQKLIEADISREIALMWKNEKKEVQDAYKREADLEKLRHHEIYPHYKYQPKPKKRNRVAKTVVQNRKSSNKKKIIQSTKKNINQEINHQLSFNNEIFQDNQYYNIPPTQCLSQEDLNIFLSYTFDSINIDPFANSNNETNLLGVCYDDSFLNILL
ncbi:unnamed protein product [Cunninghamella echinulata]